MSNHTNPTILIVDDDEAVRFAISLLVQTCGWAAKEFGSAEEFLDGHDGKHESCCLVMDLNMPGMSGADLVEELLNTSRWLPVIVVTGFPDSPLAARVRRAGVRAVLKKPFNDQLLLGHIRQALALD